MQLQHRYGAAMQLAVGNQLPALAALALLPWLQRVVATRASRTSVLSTRTRQRGRIPRSLSRGLAAMAIGAWFIIRSAGRVGCGQRVTQ
eukprot:1626736-Alexandrium_andersonii.AAC.1